MSEEFLFVKKLLTILFLLAFYLCCIIILIVRIRDLRVSTSGAHPVRKTAVESLLAKGCVTDWMHSATARHEHVAQRNANGTSSLNLE